MKSVSSVFKSPCLSLYKVHKDVADISNLTYHLAAVFCAATPQIFKNKPSVNFFKFPILLASEVNLVLTFR